jgi:hypothetical protein
MARSDFPYISVLPNSAVEIDVSAADQDPIAGIGGNEAPRCVGFYVGTTGDVSVDTEEGDTAIVFSSIPAGAVIPIAVKEFNNTGTTASDIVALIAVTRR